MYKYASPAPEEGTHLHVMPVIFLLISAILDGTHLAQIGELLGTTAATVARRYRGKPLST
jgi:hypothetical protein